VEALVTHYRKEKMPTRYSTRRSYDVWLNGHILPRWGVCPLTDLQARPVELWLTSLDLSPKSRAHISRGLVHTLWDFAMWSGSISTQRNPIELVRIKGASKRTREPRSLTMEEFHGLVMRLGTLPHDRISMRLLWATHQRMPSSSMVGCRLAPGKIDSRAGDRAAKSWGCKNRWLASSPEHRQ
jgi:hypothetical protein